MKKINLFILLISLLLISTSVLSFTADVRPISNKSYFEELHPLLKHAKKSIYIIMFEMRYYPKYPNSPANILVRDLINAAKRKVKVEVILEQSKEVNEKNTNLNRKVGLILAKAGIKVYLDPIYQTTHNKLIIVDRTYTVVGSTNWTYHGLRENNESSVLINSEEVANAFSEYFMCIKRISKPLGGF